MCESSPDVYYVSSCVSLKKKSSPYVLSHLNDIFYNEEVDLNSQLFGSGALLPLIPIFEKNKAMGCLRLADNNLPNDAVVLLCRAMHNHPRLSELYLDKNPLSLAAGLAVLQLLIANNRILTVSLQETAVPEPLARRIRNVLLQRSLKDSATQMLLTVSDRRVSRAEECCKRENEKLTLLNDVIRAAIKNATSLTLPIPAATGWNVVSMYVCAVQDAFKTELQILCDEIFPEINRELFNAGRKLFVVPRFMDSGDERSLTGDYMHAIERCFPLFLILIGERAGGLVRGAPGGKPLRRLLYHEYESGGVKSPFPIIMVRNPVTAMNVPPPFLPTFTDNPRVAFGALNYQVSGVLPSRSDNIIGCEEDACASKTQSSREATWIEHRHFMELLKARYTISHTANILTCAGYPACFDKPLPGGIVSLNKLERFKESVKKRILAVVSAYGEAGSNDAGSSTNLYHLDPLLRSFLITQKRLLSVADEMRPFACPDALKRLESYVVAPERRNMFLIHGPPCCGCTSTLLTLARRYLSSNRYFVIYHCAEAPGELLPFSDLAALFLNVIAQLTPLLSTSPLSNDSKCLLLDEAEDELYGNSGKETDIEALQARFSQSVTQAAAAAAAREQTIIFIFDALDKVEAPVCPANTLRVTSSGADRWATAPLRGDGSHRAFMTTKDRYAFIPMCLPKNVRLIASCRTNSEAYSTLENRGRDFVEVIELNGTIFLGDSASDEGTRSAVFQEMLNKEVFLPLNMEPVDVSLFRDEDDLAEEKNYMFRSQLYVLRAICARYREMSTPISLSSSFAEVLSPLLSPVQSYIHWIFVIERDVGVDLARRALILLCLAGQDGLFDWEMGEMLSMVMRLKGTIESREIPASLLYRLLRLLKEVSPQWPWSGKSARCANALYREIAIRNYEFAAAVKQKYGAQMYTQEALLLHRVMAAYYGKLMFNTDSPLQTRAAARAPIHALEAHRWRFVENTVLSLGFVIVVFNLHLSYLYIKTLIKTYNLVEAFSEIDVPVRCPRRAQILARCKEFLFFIREHASLFEKDPESVYQVAIMTFSNSLIHIDAEKHFLSTNIKIPHLLPASVSGEQAHRGACTAGCWYPNVHRFVTCGADRALQIFSSGGERVHRATYGGAPLMTLCISASSQYILTMAADGAAFLIDANTGKLISEFAPPHIGVRSVALSVRGRYTLTGGRDSVVRIFNSENGLLLGTAPHAWAARAISPMEPDITCIVCDYKDEGVFFTACMGRVLGWRLSLATNECLLLFDVVANEIAPVSELHERIQLPLEEQKLPVDAKEESPISELRFLCTCTHHVTRIKAEVEPAVKLWRADITIETQLHAFVAFLATPNSGVTPGASASTIAQSRDGAEIAVCFDDGTVALYLPPWDLFSAESQNATSNFCIQASLVCCGSENRINSGRWHATFSGDFSFVAVTGSQPLLRVYQSASFTCLKDNHAHKQSDFSDNNLNSRVDVTIETKPIAQYYADLPFEWISWVGVRADEDMECVNSVENIQIIAGDGHGRVHMLSLVDFQKKIKTEKVETETLM